MLLNETLRDQLGDKLLKVNIDKLVDNKTISKCTIPELINALNSDKIQNVLNDTKSIMGDTLKDIIYNVFLQCQQTYGNTQINASLIMSLLLLDYIGKHNTSKAIINNNDIIKFINTEINRCKELLDYGEDIKNEANHSSAQILKDVQYKIKCYQELIQKIQLSFNVEE